MNGSGDRMSVVTHANQRKYETSDTCTRRNNNKTCALINMGAILS